MGREILTLHFGQAGVQIGSALWELFCIEHGLSADGSVVQPTDNSQFSTFEHINALFNEGQKCWTPRAMLIDLEPTVIDEIRCGAYRQLWKPNCLINGKEDAANNYGRGNCTIGKLKLDEIMDTIHKLVEDTNNLAAFEIIHAHSGGTGSGLSVLVIDQLCEEYGKKFKFGTSVFPSAMYSQSTVDPYNAILNAHNTIETLDCDILVDNQTLFERCTRNLNIAHPSFTEINRLLATMLSSVFLSHRFIYHGSQHADTTELLTNLIPYPRIHFPALFYAPISPRSQMEHDTLSVSELTKMAFSPDAQTIDFPCRRNLYMSCAMLYRGVTSPKHVYDALQMVKGTPSVGASFVDWCPTGFKVGLNSFPPASYAHSPVAFSPRSICMLAGNLGMREAWHRNNLKFDTLFARRCFVHWFIGEGVEESEFLEARDDMAYLEQDYAELMGDTIPANDQPREDTKPDDNENNMQLGYRGKNVNNLHHQRHYLSKKHIDDLSMTRQSNNANSDRYYGMKMINNRLFPTTTGSTDGNQNHPIGMYPNIKSNHTGIPTKPQPRVPRRNEDMWQNSNSELHTYASHNDGHYYTNSRPVINHDYPNRSYYISSWNTNEESMDDMLHSNRILSPESGICNTSISKNPIAKEVNMNNPRLSELTNDTTFLPTNPVVQQTTITTNSMEPHYNCPDTLTDYDDYEQWSQLGDDQRDRQQSITNIKECPNRLMSPNDLNLKLGTTTSRWSHPNSEILNHNSKPQFPNSRHQHRHSYQQQKQQQQQWQSNPVSQSHVTKIKAQKYGSLSNVNTVEPFNMNQTHYDSNQPIKPFGHSISPTSGFGSMTEDPTVCDLPACVHDERSLHETISQIPYENDECLSNSTCQTALTCQPVMEHHRHRHHTHARHAQHQHHHHHHHHHHSADRPRDGIRSNLTHSSEFQLNSSKSSRSGGQEQYMSTSMIAKRPIYEVSISSSPDESRLPTPILSTWSTLDAQNEQSGNQS